MNSCILTKISTKKILESKTAGKNSGPRISTTMLFTVVKKEKKINSRTVTLLYIQMMEYYVAINNDSMTEKYNYKWWENTQIYNILCNRVKIQLCNK